MVRDSWQSTLPWFRGRPSDPPADSRRKTFGSFVTCPSEMKESGRNLAHVCNRRLLGWWIRGRIFSRPFGPFQRVYLRLNNDRTDRVAFARVVTDSGHGSVLRAEPNALRNFSGGAGRQPGLLPDTRPCQRGLGNSLLYWEGLTSSVTSRRSFPRCAKNGSRVESRSKKAVTRLFGLIK